MSDRAPDLPRTLTFRDLLLLKLVAIINVSLLPPVAGLGRPALWLWVAAFALFFIPEVVAVLSLSKRYPDEGGLYTWANRQFGSTHGFISGWYYWTGNLFYFPMQLVYLAGVLAYATYGAGSTAVDDKTFVAGVAIAWLSLVTAINFVGLGVGKWLPNVGAVCTAITAVLIASAGVVAWRTGAAVPAATALPTAAEVFSGLSVMCFAFMGVELASTMGSEIKHPERDLPRAAMAAGVLTLAVYITVTWALQQMLPPGDIGAIQGILQGVDLGTRRLGLEWFATPLALVMAVSLAGGLAAWYAGATRIPFVAGFNDALPSALGRVHPRWGSPWVALLTQGALTLAFISMTMWGSTVREGYQILLRSSVITTLIPFSYMFLGLVRLRDEPAWKRAAGVVGLLVSVVGMAAAFVPGEDVDSVMRYEVKLISGSLLPLAVGLAFFMRAQRRGRLARAGVTEAVEPA
jgi:amino acid transporter